MNRHGYLEKKFIQTDKHIYRLPKIGKKPSRQKISDYELPSMVVQQAGLAVLTKVFQCWSKLNKRRLFGDSVLKQLRGLDDTQAVVVWLKGGRSEVAGSLIPSLYQPHQLI